MENQPTTPTEIKLTRFPDSTLIQSLSYSSGHLIVVFKKNGRSYKYPMKYDQAKAIFAAPSVGKSVLAMVKDIKGIEIIE